MIFLHLIGEKKYIRKNMRNTSIYKKNLELLIANFTDSGFTENIGKYGMDL